MFDSEQVSSPQTYETSLMSCSPVRLNAPSLLWLHSFAGSDKLIQASSCAVMAADFHFQTLQE